MLPSVTAAHAGRASKSRQGHCSQEQRGNACELSRSRRSPSNRRRASSTHWADSIPASTATRCRSMWRVSRP